MAVCGAGDGRIIRKKTGKLAIIFSEQLKPRIHCMFLSCHVRVSEWIHTRSLPQCQGTPCSQQARNLNFKWLQLDSNTDPVFVYELRGSGFESNCSHLNFRFRACFKQGVLWHSGNYRVWIHSETPTWQWQEHTIKCTEQISTQNTAQSFGQFGSWPWHGKNIQSNVPYR